MTSSIQNNAENSTAGWVAEWAGPVGKSATFNAVSGGTILGRDPVSIVVGYLQTKTIGLPELINEFGAEVIREALGEKTEQIQVPYAVEKLLQDPLTDHFTDAETLRSFGQATRVMDVVTLFFKPYRLTLNILDDSSLRALIRNKDWDLHAEDYGDLEEEENQWIVRVDPPIGSNRQPEEQNALIPKGAEIPEYDDHVFTLFTHEGETPPIWKRCAHEYAEVVEPLAVLSRPSQKPGGKNQIMADFMYAGTVAVAVQWKFPAEEPPKKAE